MFVRAVLLCVYIYIYIHFLIYSITFLVEDTKMLARCYIPSVWPFYRGPGDWLSHCFSTSLKTSSFSIPSPLYCVAAQIQVKAPRLFSIEFFKMEAAVCEKEWVAGINW